MSTLDPAMYHPSRQEFLNARTRGNLVPVYREIMADSDTPVSAYAKLGRGDYSFLLESVVGGQNWAEYSFIGVDPRAVLRFQDGYAQFISYDEHGQPRDEESFETARPMVAIESFLSRFRPVSWPGLPRFWGGAVGWIGYDVVRTFEKLGPAPISQQPGHNIPTLCMVVTDTVVIFDNLRQTLKVVATAHLPEDIDEGAAAERYDQAVARVDALLSRLQAPLPVGSLPTMEPPLGGQSRSAGHQAPELLGKQALATSMPRPQYMAAVERIRDYILAGDIFQAVLSQRLDIDRGDVDLFDVYRALRVINPSPYMYHLDFPEARVTGASPETLVRCADGLVEVRPIAGTRPRGATEAEDRALAEELQTDPKECAEHLMLVDLGRNDVGRVATTGTVEVSEYMGIERYSHVMHMVSHVRGQLAADLTWRDVLRSAFPAGTLSGAPKIRAMEIIDELEPEPRGLYGGAVGYISYSGNMDLAIAIRTLVSTGATIHAQAGAGIVHDSDPAMEYEETLAKAYALLRALAVARTAANPAATGADED